MSDNRDVLESFKEDVSEALRDNLICLLHHGSRAKGEARSDSDYDSIIVTRKVNEEVIGKLHTVFLKYPQFSSYLLGLGELKTVPRGQCLQFLYAKPLYGTLDVQLPTEEETINYITDKSRDTLDTIRHMLMFPHSIERKTKLVYYSLKDVYICLSYLAFSETHKLPLTRKETISYFKKQRRQNLGIRLLKILENWDSHKEKITKAPDLYLFQLEEFFRKLDVSQT